MCPGAYNMNRARLRVRRNRGNIEAQGAVSLFEPFCNTSLKYRESYCTHRLGHESLSQLARWMNEVEVRFSLLLGKSSWQIRPSQCHILISFYSIIDLYSHNVSLAKTMSLTLLFPCA